LLVLVGSLVPTVALILFNFTHTRCLKAPLNIIMVLVGLIVATILVQMSSVSVASVGTIFGFMFVQFGNYHCSVFQVALLPKRKTVVTSVIGWLVKDIGCVIGAIVGSILMYEGERFPFIALIPVLCVCLCTLVVATIVRLYQLQPNQDPDKSHPPEPPHKRISMSESMCMINTEDIIELEVKRIAKDKTDKK
jgi:uncharacterized membrane protein